MDNTGAESGSQEIATPMLEELSTIPPAGLYDPNAD
jgi:hypothetical protein